MPTIEIRDVPEVPILFQSMTTGHDTIGATCGIILPAVGTFMNERAIVSAGPPFTRYTQWRETDCDLDSGFPISARVETDGIVTLGMLGGCQAATTIHQGPYSTLSETYNLIFTWLHEQGGQSQARPGKFISMILATCPILPIGKRKSMFLSSECLLACGEDAPLPAG